MTMTRATAYFLLPQVFIFFVFTLYSVFNSQNYNFMLEPATARRFYLPKVLFLWRLWSDCVGLSNKNLPQPRKSAIFADCFSGKNRFPEFI
jgi:hypothetical protein